MGLGAVECRAVWPEASVVKDRILANKLGRRCREYCELCLAVAAISQSCRTSNSEKLILGHKKKVDGFSSHQLWVPPFPAMPHQGVRKLAPAAVYAAIQGQKRCSTRESSITDPKIAIRAWESQMYALLGRQMGVASAMRSRHFIPPTATATVTARD
ncbi:uncharacterized protein BCR38DRAFT_523614 [Pseudomassariella vexata]|uniref:Uncharacterized protein n=1 Tax=Pseudomassariella vexata TaxID=1141098 RepID=A0A1Y2E0L5_9PEZI|nr:uncharacterized protein BCR38DRAFT_523614 [Pseudomassariella vexata]ORY65080.1 hypothetical protein BCR38DRAFT_523614 [Pseudomassariella vexata]